MKRWFGITFLLVVAAIVLESALGSGETLKMVADTKSAEHLRNLGFSTNYANLALFAILVALGYKVFRGAAGIFSALGVIFGAGVPFSVAKLPGVPMESFVSTIVATHVLVAVAVAIFFGGGVLVRHLLRKK